MANDDNTAGSAQPKIGPMDEAIAQAIGSTDVPKIYTNGFAVALGNADVLVMLQRQKQPVAVLNLSYTLAKTLAQKLGQVVTEFEKTIQQNILTTDRIDTAFQGAQTTDAPKSEADDSIH